MSDPAWPLLSDIVQKLVFGYTSLTSPSDNLFDMSELGLIQTMCSGLITISLVLYVMRSAGLAAVLLFL